MFKNHESASLKRGKLHLLVGLIILRSLIFSLSAEATFSCKKCAATLCSQCLNLQLSYESKQREITRLENVVLRNQEVLKKNRSASILIKVNSNILLGSLNKEALKTELLDIVNKLKECSQCK